MSTVEVPSKVSKGEVPSPFEKEEEEKARREAERGEFSWLSAFCRNADT